jgi:hypothetical protein
MAHRFSAALAPATWSRLRRQVALVVAFAVAALLASGASWGKEPKAKEKPPAPPIKWDLKRLDREPLKLIKSTPDFEHRRVMFLVEFTRAPTPSELFDWEQKGVVLFRFLDADGVILGSVRPEWLGEFVPKAGTRLRLILQLPSDRAIDATSSIVAD